MQHNNKKKYKTIMVDPPWDVMQRGTYGAKNHYNLMTVDQIKTMPIADLAEDDAHLWLWFTSNTWRQAHDVAEAWGFTPRSIFTWVKPRFTLGNWLRNSTEWMIFATRGKLPVKFKGQGTWGFFPLQDHSHKPEEQFAIIERVSPGPYLELFARRNQPGWDAWGNEIDSDIEIPGYPVPRVKGKEVS